MNENVKSETLLPAKRSLCCMVPVEKLHSIRLILLRRLPRAIYGKPIHAKQSITVFAQHSPSGEYLESRLKYLTQNGYGTVTASQYARWLDGQWAPDWPSVMLTFDDGLRRFQDNTLPLLRKYGLKSTLFVCPGLVELSSQKAGKLGQLAHRAILTWDELRALAEAGDVDIQSHGMWHNKVRYSNRVAGEGIREVKHILGCPELLPPDGRIEAVIGDQSEVAESYPSIPFFAASPHDGSVVAKAGMRNELSLAKKMIEENLQLDQVRAFAFPWWNGSREACQAARETGYDLLFWGLAPLGPDLRASHIDRSRIGRLGFDWISCLPGEGRVSVLQLLKSKIGGL